MRASPDGRFGRVTAATSRATRPVYRSAIASKAAVVGGGPGPAGRTSDLAFDVAGQQRQVGGAEAVLGVEVVPEGVGQRLGADLVQPLDVGRCQLQVGRGQVVGQLLFGSGA